MTLTELAPPHRPAVTPVRANAEPKDRDSELAAYLLGRLLRIEQDADPRIETSLNPSEQVGGDIIVTARSSDGRLYLLLGDAVGHGLAAALNAIPVVETFRAMAHKGYAVATIMREIDRKLAGYFPPDRFVAVAVAAIDFRSCRMEFANAGLPPAWLLDRGGRLVLQLPSRQPPLGIGAFDIRAGVEYLGFPDGAQLLLVSDGLLEAESPQGQAFGADRLATVLRASRREHRFSAVLHAIERHVEGRGAHDDASLILVHLDKEPAEQGATTVAGGPAMSSPTPGAAAPSASVEFRLDAKMMKVGDCVPRIVTAVSTLLGRAPCLQQIEVILAELFQNALDHGLLGLGLAADDWPGGYEAYMRERAQRLSRLERGTIRVRLSSCKRDGGIERVLEVEDSGPGFDHASMPERPNRRRGIAQVRRLAKGVQYHGDGNRVEVLI
ncbi:MAG: serine/threonine-protein phosphatase [Rhodocyclaceae bacterium]|nr:serine/threonine-protein phosphatase [Rhodocyclaceae bacterium]